MHDIKSIRDNPEAFDAALKRRGLAPLSVSLLAIDEARRTAILASEQAQARRNAASKEIGEAKKTKDEVRANALMAEVTELKTTMPAMEAAVKNAEDKLKVALAEIRTCRSTKCLRVSTNTAMLSVITSAPGATTRSRRKLITISAKPGLHGFRGRGANSRAHASSC